MTSQCMWPLLDYGLTAVCVRNASASLKDDFMCAQCFSRTEGRPSCYGPGRWYEGFVTLLGSSYPGGPSRFIVCYRCVAFFSVSSLCSRFRCVRSPYYSCSLFVCPVNRVPCPCSPCMITSVFRVRCIHFSVLSLSLPPQALINVSIISLTVLRGIEVNVAEADEVPHWLISFRLFIFLLLPLPHTTALLFSQTFVLFWSHVVDFLRRMERAWFL